MYLIWLIRQDVLIVKLLQNSGDNIGLQKGCYVSICDSLKHRNFEILISPFYLCITQNKIIERGFFKISLINIFSVFPLLCLLEVLHFIHPTALPRFWHLGVLMMKWKEIKNCWKSVKENSTQLESIARSGCRSVIPHVGGGKGKKS